MKILLTGASGFTGPFFKAYAEMAGHVVVPLTANLTDQSAVVSEVQFIQPEAVVHLAGISFVGHADERAFYDVNVIGTTHLLKALTTLSKQPIRVLLASSANVYGNCAASPVAEQQPPAPINHYAMSKLAMEHMALTFSDKLHLIIARPFNYTGKGQAFQFLIPKLVSHFIQKAHSIELGNLDVEREFNDVRTVCETYLKLLLLGLPGERYNVCSGRTYSLLNVVNILEKLTQHSMQINVNPAYVRVNEVHKLGGSADKLVATIGSFAPKSLEDTLSWMLAP
jgi:GDP-6-deoxy-D-talose 4-dehydrogenase